MPPTSLRSPPAQAGAWDIDRRRAEAVVLDLLALPGRSGEEAQVAGAIAGLLRRAGAPASAIRFDAAHRLSPRGGAVGNLILKLPGSLRLPRRLLMAHMDTVPICAGARPARRGRRVISSARGTGLGGDDRAGAAAVLVAALEILERRLPHPPLTLVWTVQEEVGLFGARFLDAARLGRPSAAFNFDGASPAEIVIGATGALRMRISIHGFAAHAGAHPDRGVSAIAVAGLGIARLQEGGWHGLVRKGRRRGTSNVGVFQAGEATNVVTDHALLRAEARSHDRRFRRRILAAYREAFAWAAAQVRDARGRRARVRFEASKDYESFRLPETLPCVRLAEGAVRGIGRKPSLRVVDGGLDANWLNARGIPAVTLGIGQREIHTAREWLDLDDYLDGCRLALALAAPPA